ncbi:hypothetical protein SLE2022_025570 [Rubroshorea leprosula]
MGMQACVLIFNLWFSLAFVLRVRSLFQTKPLLPRGDEEGQERDVPREAQDFYNMVYYMVATGAEHVPLFPRGDEEGLFPRGDEEGLDIDAMLDFDPMDYYLEPTEAEHAPLFPRGDEEGLEIDLPTAMPDFDRMDYDLEPTEAEPVTLSPVSPSPEPPALHRRVRRAPVEHR